MKAFKMKEIPSMLTEVKNKTKHLLYNSKHKRVNCCITDVTLKQSSGI